MFTLKLTRNQLLSLLILVFFLVFVPTIAFSNESIDLNPISTLNQSSSVGLTSNSAGVYQADLPSVEIEEAANFLGGKMQDLVLGLQIIIKPLCVLIAGICIVMSVFGIIGDSRLLSRGLMGLFLTAICYFGVMYAPEIVDFINSWFSSGTEFLGK